ncbi:MAG: histidine phosphatase family protein [Rhizobiaceae bacterium]
MVTLYLLRHAKSSWAEPGKTDFDRTLNSRGHTDLPEIAAMMKERGFVPQHVFCSDALRTKMTWDGVRVAFDPVPPVVYEHALYAGEISDYLDCLRGLSDKGSAMIVGHNPMCEGLAGELVNHGDPAALSAFSQKYPTGALAVIDLDIENWSEIAPGSGYLRAFIAPRDL